MNDTLLKIINHPLRTPIAVGVGGFAAGLGLGFFLGKREGQKGYLVPEYGKIVEESIDMTQMKVDVIEPEIPKKDKTPKAPKFKDLEVGEHFVKKALNETKEAIALAEPEEELIRYTVFKDGDSEWSTEEETKKRNPRHPYVLHRDEFFADEKNFTQHTYTYYAGDDIMVDEDDHPVYNYSDILGILLFGHGSGDPNVVYIRNEKRRAEYEILFDKGLFSTEVLGLEIEDNDRVKDLKHSNQRKFRLDE